MEKNYKKDAIEILKVMSEGSYKDIMFEIAKSNPYALIRAYEIINKEVEPLVKERISAVELVRINTGCELKECKEFCDKIRYEGIVDMSILGLE